MNYEHHILYEKGENFIFQTVRFRFITTDSNIYC